MPRSKLIRTDLYPYHITARSSNKEWFYLPLARVWEIFSDLLNGVTKEFSLQIHAFVLMSNHFHALVTTPDMDLEESMEYLLCEGARRINCEAGRIQHVFGGPYQWSVISNQRYYEHAVRYVYQNPIKARMVDRVEAYPYSSIFYLHRKVPLKFPIFDSLFERQSVMDLALWQKLDLLNTQYDNEQIDCIRRALRHSVFSCHPGRASKRIPADLLLQLKLTKECHLEPPPKSASLDYKAQRLV